MTVNYKYLNQGLVHKIYKNNDYILKVPKDQFEDFNNMRHFQIEKVSHQILSKNSIPAVPISQIFRKNVLIKGKNVLQEKYVNGIVIDNSEINEFQRKEIVNIMLKVNKIKIERFGDIMPNGCGRYVSWKSYIGNSITNISDLIKSIPQSKLTLSVENLKCQLSLVPQIKYGVFLLLDTNSNNFIFNDNNRIIALVDVDHPISGDPLYEYGALKWFHPKSYELLNNTFLKIDRETLPLLSFYYKHFGLKTFQDIGQPLLFIQLIIRL